MEQPIVTIREQYKGVAVKLYDLCDYINKRAGILSALNYTFTTKELDILKVVQVTKDQMQKLSEDIDNAGNAYDDLDVDYEIYMQYCRKCNGSVKVINFAENELGHRCNIYKCDVCGEEYQDEYPNKHEHVIEYFKVFYEVLDMILADKNIKEKDKLMFTKEYKKLQKSEKILIAANEDVIEKREVQRKAINAAIIANEVMYDELLKYKNLFDRNIGEA